MTQKILTRIQMQYDTLLNRVSVVSCRPDGYGGVKVDVCMTNITIYGLVDQYSGKWARISQDLMHVKDELALRSLLIGFEV